MSGTTTRAPAGAAVRIPVAQMAAAFAARVELLWPAGHARYLAETHPSPAADAIAAGHAQAPAAIS
jgi:hypothetical protein